MEAENKEKIRALDEAVKEELDLLSGNLKYHTERIRKYGEEVLKIINSESVQNAHNLKSANVEKAKEAERICSNIKEETRRLTQ